MCGYRLSPMLAHVDTCALQMLNKIALCSSEPVRKWLDDKTRDASCM